MCRLNNFVQFVSRWKVFVNELKKRLGNVRSYVFTVGRIKPLYYVTFSVSLVCIVRVVVVFTVCRVSEVCVKVASF